MSPDFTPPPLTFAEALDHVQAWHSRVVRPFDKLQQVLQVAATAESHAQNIEAQLEKKLFPKREEYARLDAAITARHEQCDQALAERKAAAEEPVRLKLAELAALTAELDRKRGEGAELDAAIAQKKEHLRTLTAAVAGVEAIR